MSLHARSRSRTLVAVLAVVACVLAVVVGVLLARRAGPPPQTVVVPSVISLPATEVQDALGHAGLVPAPVLVGWKRTVPPWGSIAFQVPPAGSHVAVGTSVRVGVYLGTPGGPYPAGWPRSFSGQLHVQGGYGNPERFGAAVTRSELQFGPISSKSFVGPDGYALATIDGFEYPIATSDAGRSWRVAGLWFAGAWADAAAFADTIRAYSRDVALAFHPGQVFYATTDGGAHWFDTYFPGNVGKVAAGRGGRGTVFVVHITNYAGAKRAATYRSSDAGRTWTLVGQSGLFGYARVPNLEGLSVAQARQRLRALGYLISVEHLFIAGSSPEVVTSQMPEAGARAPRGASVAVAIPH